MTLSTTLDECCTRGCKPAGLDFGLRLVKTVIDDYGDAPWLRDDLVTRMLLYAAIFIISSMAGEFSSGAPWPPFWPAQSTVLSDVLNAMDCPPALA